MDDALVEDFFGSLAMLDPLGAGLPRTIQHVRSQWSEADVHHLPRLLRHLEKALTNTLYAPRDFQTAIRKVNSETAAFLCLEAICAIQRSPDDVPPVVRDCLLAPDISLRFKALAYIGRAKSVDGQTIAAVRSVLRDAKGSIGNRLYALWVLWCLGE